MLVGSPRTSVELDACSVGARYSVVEAQSGHAKVYAQKGRAADLEVCRAVLRLSAPQGVGLVPSWAFLWLSAPQGPQGSAPQRQREAQGVPWAFLRLSAQGVQTCSALV